MMLITVPLNLWMRISLTQWLLLFVCLKDSQDKEKVLKSYDFRTFWWR